MVAALILFRAELQLPSRYYTPSPRTRLWTNEHVRLLDCQSTIWKPFDSLGGKIMGASLAEHHKNINGFRNTDTTYAVRSKIREVSHLPIDPFYVTLSKLKRVTRDNKAAKVARCLHFVLQY